MWDGYFAIDDSEVINAMRLEKELLERHVSWFKPTVENPHIDKLLEVDPGVQRMSERPPWRESATPESREFLGVYPLNIQGFDDSTTITSVSERITQGSSSVGRRKAGRSMVFEVMLVASTQRGATLGMDWLKNALLGRCGGAQGCGGATLHYMSSEPLLGGSVVVEDLNYAINPSCEVDGGWLSNNTNFYAVTPDSTIRRSGVRSYRSTKVGAANAAIMSMYGAGMTDGSRVPCTPGERLCSSYYVRAGQNGYRTMVSLTFWDAAGNNIPSATINGSYIPATWGAWVRPFVTGIAPAGAVGYHASPIVSTASGGNAVNGDYANVDDALHEKGRSTPSAYFSGSSTDTDQATYHWQGNQHVSRSVRRTLPPDNCEQPVLTSSSADEELRRVGRYLRRVEVVTPPVVQQRRKTHDGYHLWNVTFTLHANNPLEISLPQLLVDGWRNGGSVIPDQMYYLNTATVPQESCVPRTYVPIFDPLNPQVAPPPLMESPKYGGYTLPTQWERSQIVVAAAALSGIGTAVPVYRLTTSTAAVRGVRLRVYPDIEALRAVTPAVECDWSSDLLVTYIPPGSTMTIDPLERRVYVTDSNGVQRRADSLVVSSDGGPIIWPEMPDGIGYILTYDAATSPYAWLEVDLVRRFS